MSRNTGHAEMVRSRRTLSLKGEECVSIFLSISLTCRLQQNIKQQLNIGTFYAQREASIGLIY